ncbi:HAMP domain-containing sensor histidine kinase [Paenibacillus sp. HB172176]|uniref:HAMP domain-containing sensor histidine kinase n=1 Tax=Paenibacillus sp. HB172176 TaxID=2493690 RepID=UPI00143BCE06|nr:HAMP domain-containing sensor histidine kinase [Paenibacillus sp. HB172176]
MNNGMRSFRSRMIAWLGLSMLVSGVITYALYKALQYYYRENARYGDPVAYWRRMIKEVGDVNFFLIVFVPLSILFFFLFTNRYASYFNSISSGIHNLAVGNFQSRVELHSGDEFETIAEDINRASAQLKKAVERGDFAESSKDQLLLNLAHDLRTPLTSVLGYLDFLLKNDDLTPEQIRHYTTIAHTKSLRLEKLIEELFGIAKMNYGMLSIEKKPIDLSELLHQLSEEMYPVFEKNRISARLRAAPGIIVEGEGELLARVFENLVMNAARYGKDGQFVDIEARLESIEEENAAAAVVQVINYGHVIAEEELPLLFDMFYTGDKARSPQEGGTGLGLFIAKNIVEQHGGTITADSSITRTVFEVRLPVRTND